MENLKREDVVKIIHYLDYHFDTDNIEEGDGGFCVEGTALEKIDEKNYCLRYFDNEEMTFINGKIYFVGTLEECCQHLIFRFA